jgi:hypothetical protein
MAEEVTARVSRYVNDGSDQDLRRLLSVACGVWSRDMLDNFGSPLG